MKQLLFTGAIAMSVMLSCTSSDSDKSDSASSSTTPSDHKLADSISRSVAPSSPAPGEPKMADTTYKTAKGEFYCEGNVAADGMGCMVKIDGVVYKMQKENGELYEDAAIFTKAGKAVPVNVEYRKTGTHFKLMNKADGPELITIRSVQPIK